MTFNLVRAVFTIDVDDRPMLTFEAKSLREARELCHEHWLKEDLLEARSAGVPLWDGKAKLKARPALPEEAGQFADAKNTREPTDDLMLVFLIELDSEGTT
jgi:hypothetical protein